MNRDDQRNVQRVMRKIASDWRCPVWKVESSISIAIDRCWETARSNPEEKKLWDMYFPEGKPTPAQYILLLGHAHERGEKNPNCFMNSIVRIQAVLRSIPVASYSKNYSHGKEYSTLLPGRCGHRPLLISYPNFRHVESPPEGFFRRQ